MSNFFKIYWLTRLSVILGFAMFAFVTAIIILLVYYIAYFSEWYDEDDRKELYKRRYGVWKNSAFWVLFVSSFILAFVPNKNDMILIYAGGSALDYVQKDTSLSKIPYQTTSIISEYMDKYVKELKDSK